MVTRFMQVMFSAVENEDEELTNQVAEDVEAAKSSESGVVDTDEVTYVNLGSGKVLVTDKGNGESTVIEQDPEDEESYSLEGIENDEELEKYLHTLDGTTPDESVLTEEHENVEDHMTGEDVIAPNLEDGGLNPQAGMEPTVGENAAEDEYEDEYEEEDDEEREFSVSTDNTAVLHIFSDHVFYDRLFSEVITEDKPAIVGDLKIEKCEECPDSVIVTDLTSGDEAKVTLEDEDMVVTEVQKEFEDEKEFSEEEQFEPLYVVGIDPVDHVLVDSPVYDEEDAQILAQRLEEDGVEAVNIFDDPDQAREYAVSLLGEVGVSEVEQIAEPEEREFSDCTLYLTRYFSEDDYEESMYSEDDFSDCTDYMIRLFSEAEEGDSTSQDVIEDAIESGEQIENETEIVTPIDSETAIVEDKETGEFTKVTLDGEDIDTEAISEEEADELTEDLATSEDEEEDSDEDDEELEDSEKDDEEEEKSYSTLDKFFAEIVDPNMVAPQAVQEAPAMVDPSQINPETGDAVVAPEEAVVAPVESVEGIEDKALAAVQSIQEAANDAVLAIQQAKEAPAPGEEQDLQEAHFSEIENNNNGSNTLVNWLNNKF